MFSQFLKEKLKAEQINVDTAAGDRDAFAKLITTLPDLIIIEVKEEITDVLQEFLEKKYADLNAKKIPIIMTGPKIAPLKVATMAEYGVVKYFKKPIQFNIFFESIGKILKTNFSFDTTPSILDIHLNGEIIFIEISRGLNREKLFLLKYKLSEIIRINNIKIPKIVLMMTGISISFVDAINLELLFDNITADEKINRKNIKVLSLDDFTKKFLDGHPQYNGIEIATDITSVLSDLVEKSNSLSTEELLTEKVLNSDREIADGDILLRFDDNNQSTNDLAGNSLKIAIVDDDIIIRKLLQSAFASIGAQTTLFESGMEFTKQIMQKIEYDLIILDIFIPDIDGFSILKNLQRHNYTKPIIVYSQATSKDAILQSITLGAKSYLVKPQKPQTIVSKALEILKEEG